MLGRVFRFLAVAASAACLTACASTPGPVIVEDATALRAGISTVREQQRAAFGAANKLARDQAIEAQVLAAKPLDEALFPVAVNPADAARWSDDLAVLETYAAALQKLAGPSQSQATGDALAALGNQLATGKTQLKVPVGVQGLAQTFGQALIQASAEKTATAAMARADGGFQTVMRGMADAIGSSPAPGNLQGTVQANWVGPLAAIQVQYAPLTVPANAGKTEERRKLIRLFIAALEARDAQLRDLGALHDSLLALGELHAAAARGKPGDAAYWVQRLTTWTEEVRKNTAAARKAQEEAVR